MSFLILACLGLLVGPALSFAGSKLGRVHSLVDGFSLALVGGLCVAVALPEAVAELGFTGLGLAAAGLAVPWLSHRFRPEGPWSLGIVAVALAAHVVLDGAILAVGEADEPLTWAVIAHRLPVGFALVIVGGSFSRNPAQVVWGLAGMMVSATVTGFLGGAALLGALPPVAVTGMEAFVAGVLLHIVVTPHDHGHHDHAEVAHQRDDHGHADVDVHGHTHGQACDHDHEDHHGHSHGSHDHGHHHGHTHGSAHQGNAWGATGAVAGLGALIVAAMLMPHGHHGEALDFVPTLTVLVLESAPALLLGYGLAGIAPSLLTPSTLGALARGGRAKQALRGVAFGLPLPVCSCGVLPLYESLVRRGAPPVAAIAFFVATPELGLDAVLLSVPLLGSSLTLARVVAALVVALIVALIVGSGISAQSPIGEESSHGDETRPLSVRIREGLRFGFVEVFDHTMPWIILGLIIAAFAEPLLSEDAISAVPTALQVPVAALVGIPLYVCASGATPVAALALHKGLSAGAAISFLIAGPATNVTTFGVLAKLHGRRMAMLFGVSVTVLAVLAGWTVDILGVPAAPVLDAHAVPDAHGGPVAWVCVVALAALCLSSLYRQGPRGALRQILEPIHMH